MSTVIWSREPDLGTVGSGTYVDYNFTAKIERPIPVDPLNPNAPTIEIIDVNDLVYVPVDDKELPEELENRIEGASIRLTGTLRAEAGFRLLRYTSEGIAYPVEEFKDVPEGSTFCDMVPSSNEYIEYAWLIFSESMPELVNREYRLSVRMSWDEAKKTIQEKVNG